MGTLANSLFRAMMGWIRSLSSQIWSTAASAEGSTLLSWIGAHWKGLALLLCAVGIVLDLIVYLVRWQPYRAWRSFFRRLGRRNAARESDPREDIMAADESVSEEYSPEGSGSPRIVYKETAGPSAERYSAGENRASGIVYRDEMTAAAAEDERDQAPEERAVWTRNEPEGTTAAFEEALRPRRRRSVSRLFAENEDAATPPDQLIDRYAAYRRPVYPRSWKNADAEEEDGGI